MSTCPSGEADRLTALQALQILDTPSEDHFEAVCRTARRMFAVPSAYVSMIDSDRQWLKTACHLVPQNLLRSEAFCDHTIRGDAVLAVTDLRQDSRFAANQLVTGTANVRFYAGAPLILRSGIRVGALCLVDTAPRAFSDDDVAALSDLAVIVVTLLHLGEANALGGREAASRAVREQVIEAQASPLRMREMALGDANSLLPLAESIAHGGHWPSAMADGQPVRLLLVEDVRLNQELAKAVLEIKGYRVDVVDDGADAVATVRAAAEGPDPYDLVLMDVQMPGMDGLTATRLIRAIPGHAGQVPIVAMTANVLPRQIDDLRAAGMNDHVGKPFKRPELYAVIDRWVDRERSRQRENTSSAPFVAADAASRESMLDHEAFASIKERMGTERIQSLLMLLEDELHARFAAMDLSSLEVVDRVQLAHDAHAMVSAAGILGFASLSALCREVETACHAGADLASLIHRLNVLRGSAIQQIRALRAV